MCIVLGIDGMVERGINLFYFYDFERKIVLLFDHTRTNSFFLKTKKKCNGQKIFEM